MQRLLPPRLGRREHRRLARLVHDAQQQGRPVQALSQRFPELTVADARAVRDELVARRLAEGERLVGAKASGSGGERELAWLTSGMVRKDTADRLSLAAGCDRSVALVLRGLPSRSGLDVASLLAATEEICLCLESQEPARPQRLDALAANLHTTSVSLRSRQDLDPEPVMEPLLWLAGCCVNSGSPLAAVARAGRFILVSPPLLEATG